MIHVTNLSPGRVQIRSKGRATEGGAVEIVDGIDARLLRLRDAGLVSWPKEPAEALRPQPADAPAPPKLPAKPEPPPEPPKAELPPAPEPPELPEKSEILEIAAEGLREILPPTEVVEEEAPKATAEPVAADADLEAPPAEEPAEETTDADVESPVEDGRVEGERGRLADLGWTALKAEAKDRGIKGRSRETIEDRMLEAFVADLA